MLHKRSVCLVALALLLLGVVTVTSDVWMTGSLAHGEPGQVTTASTTGTTASTTTTPAGSITFTSPSSGESFVGPQSYTISGTITPTPSSRDNVSIVVTLLGFSSVIDSSIQAVTTSGTFSYSTHVGGTPSWSSGTYVISATDSYGATGTTTLHYAASATTTTTTISTATTIITTTSTSSTASTSTALSTVGSITFTSPSSSNFFVGPQGYTIGGSISPGPSLPDEVSIDVTLLGSSASVDFATQTVTASGTFSYSTQMGGASWVTGTYVISTTDSHGIMGLTTFHYTAPAATTTTTTTTTPPTTTTSTSTTSITTKSTSTSVSTATTPSQPTTTTTVTHTVTPAPSTITSTATTTLPPSTVTSTATTTPAPSTITSTATTTLAPSTLTKTSTQIATSTVTQTNSVIPDWAYGAMIVLMLLGLAIGYVVKKPSNKKS